MPLWPLRVNAHKYHLLLEIGVKSFGHHFRDFTRTITVIERHNRFCDIQHGVGYTGCPNVTNFELQKIVTPHCSHTLHPRVLIS